MMRIAACFVVATLLAACANNSPAPVWRPDAGGTGGAAGSATGGQPGFGGLASTGGVGGVGGALATGGTSSTGGAATSHAGGNQGTGGGAGTGGSTFGTGGASAGGTDGGNDSRNGASDSGSDAGGDSGSDAKDVNSTDAARDSLVPETRPTVLDVPGSDTTASTTLSVYVAGDSTVSTYTNSSIHQAGWGQYLQDYFVANAKIVNKAVGGMTARHFIEEGYLDQILAVIKAGDYLLVQFGTNDSNKTATYTLSGSTTEIPYYLDPQTDFKTYLTKYVDGTKAKGATTIFVTPPPRHTCNAGETGVRNGLSAYAAAMNELGPTLQTPVVDLNAMTISYLAKVTCESSGSSFYLVKADGTTDGTHFQEAGANVLAGLIAKGTTGISTLSLPLSTYVK